jgi:hypothetical protein
MEKYKRILQEHARKIYKLIQEVNDYNVFPSIYVKKFGLIFCGKHFPEEIRDIHKK